MREHGAFWDCRPCGVFFGKSEQVFSRREDLWLCVPAMKGLSWALQMLLENLPWYFFSQNLSGCLPCHRDGEQNLQEHRWIPSWFSTRPFSEPPWSLWPSRSYSQGCVTTKDLTSAFSKKKQKKNASSTFRKFFQFPRSFQYFQVPRNSSLQHVRAAGAVYASFMVVIYLRVRLDRGHGVSSVRWGGNIARNFSHVKARFASLTATFWDLFSPALRNAPR